jgi:hypothetical protein
MYGTRGVCILSHSRSTSHHRKACSVSSKDSGKQLMSQSKACAAMSPTCLLLMPQACSIPAAERDDLLCCLLACMSGLHCVHV